MSDQPELTEEGKAVCLMAAIIMSGMYAGFARSAHESDTAAQATKAARAIIADVRKYEDLTET